MHNEIFTNNIGKYIRFNKGSVRRLLPELFDKTFVLQYSSWIKDLCMFNRDNVVFVMYRGNGDSFRYYGDRDVCGDVIYYNSDTVPLGSL